MKVKKYEFTGETLEYKGHTLHRIKAVKNMKSAQKGDLGGWIESEDNLSHYGDCWVFHEAKVYGGAKLFENAIAMGNAEVYGDARMFNESFVNDNAKVYEWAYLYDDASVFGHGQVCGKAELHERAEVFGHAIVTDHACITEYGAIFGNALICGTAIVSGMANIDFDAKVADNRDYIVFKNFWSSGSHFTWTRSNNMWKVGCFYYTGEELVKKAYMESEESGKNYERVVNYVKSII